MLLRHAPQTNYHHSPIMSTTPTTTPTTANVFVLQVGERRSSVPLLDRANIPSFVKTVLNEAKLTSTSGLLLRHNDGVSLVRVVTPLDDTQTWVFCASCETTMNEATWKKHRLVEGDHSCKNHPGRIAPGIKVVTENDVPDNFWTDDDNTGNAAANTCSLDGIPNDGAKNGEDVAAVTTKTTKGKKARDGAKNGEDVAAATSQPSLSVQRIQ